jgi:hypothetical protein
MVGWAAKGGQTVCPVPFSRGMLGVSGFIRNELIV